MTTEEANLPSFINDPTVAERTVAENKLAIAFLGKMPIVPGHTLICPKREIPKSEELSFEEWKSILELKTLVCKKLIKAFHAEGFNFAWNEGELAGQTVPHFHLHVLPRKNGDTGILQYEPRSFLYRPGTRAITPTEELVLIATLLRN